MKKQSSLTEWLQQVAYPLSDRKRGDLIYAGKLVVFKDVPAVQALCSFSDSIVKQTFGSDPQAAQFRLTCDEYLDMAADLRERFRRHREPKRLFAAALEEVGVDLTRTYWDRMLLRVLPHGDTHAGGPVSRIGFHRDTWGSNLYQQINWWAPVYPLTPERTISFFPYYWSHPVKNTSADWSFSEYMAHRRSTEPSRATPYPSAPTPSEEVDTSSELRVVIDPGDMLCFSGAHLHASAPNTSGAARFSIEIRTVNIDDIKSHRQAPNVDGAATEIMARWFRRISDNLPLADAMGNLGHGITS